MRIRRFLVLSIGVGAALEALAGSGEPSAGRAAAARAVAAELRERFPDGPGPLLVSAGVERRAGALDRSLEMYSRALSLDGSLAEAHEARGDILAQKGRPEEAAREYGSAAAAGGEELDRARLSLKRGTALLNAGRLEEAQSELLLARSGHPRDGTIRFQLAQALLLSKDGAGALRELEEARRLGEPEPAVDYAAARAHFLLGDGAAGGAALERFRRGRREPPAEAEARARREGDLERLDRRNLALAHLEAAGLYRRAGLPADARRHLEAALEADPLLSAARFLLAQLCEETGDLERAAGEYGRLLPGAPAGSPLHAAAARLWRRRVRELLSHPASAGGRLEDALVWSQKALDLEASGSSHETAAWACLALGREAEGLAHLREAVRLEPLNQEYRRRLAALEEKSRPR